jgi:ABC-type polysaccharide/polyol phosphate export permease
VQTLPRDPRQAFGEGMMEKYQISRAMRFFFLVAGSLLWAGIWLTGFATVHWLLYIPAVFFLFAAATGICPGMIFSNLLFGKRSNA